MLHHVEDTVLNEVVESLARVLKQDGKVYVIEFLAQPHGILEDELIRLFNNNGLSEILIYRKKNTALFEFNKN